MEFFFRKVKFGTIDCASQRVPVVKGETKLSLKEQIGSP
jgi:hypothetical protein